MKSGLTALLFATLFLTLTAGEASASLIGDVATVTRELADGTVLIGPTTSPTIQAGSADEFLFGVSGCVDGGTFGTHCDHSIDIDGNSITVYGERTLTYSAAVQFLVISDLDWLPNPGTITAATLAVNQGVAQLDQADITFTNDAGGSTLLIRLSATDWDWNGGGTLRDRIRVDLTTSHVPEPGTVALVGLGIAGLAARRRISSTG